MTKRVSERHPTEAVPVVEPTAPASRVLVLAGAAQRSGRADGQTATATRVETVLGRGGSWAEALHDVPWADGDVLVVGTSHGPLSRFFLGSHAAKIVRNSPVPVMLLPRGHAQG